MIFHNSRGWLRFQPAQKEDSSDTLGRSETISVAISAPTNSGPTEVKAPSAGKGRGDGREIGLALSSELKAENFVDLASEGASALGGDAPNHCRDGSLGNDMKEAAIRG